MSVQKLKLLIVEDDLNIKKLLTISFEAHDFEVFGVSSIKDAISTFVMSNPDIVILDLGLSDGDGKEFLEKIREFSQIPIIILSARNRENEIIECFDKGADDYVIKPFSVKELFARVKSALRRYKKEGFASKIKCGDLELDFINRVILLKNKELKLTPIEYNLLKYLMANSGKVLVHHQLLKEVWGVGYQKETQYLRVFINQLRKKIEDNSAFPKYIITESGIGYRFVCF
ncbi:MAG: response regulator transcription factor [Campylobacterales bacterium]|nr:response regulator transcription factor [Campylobacterales bacterium]